MIREAAGLARHFGAEIQVLHVVKPLTYMGRADAARKMLDQDLSHEQEKLKECLGMELDGLAINQVVLKGDPAGELLRWAHEQKTDLIVMPTHGYGAVERLLLGSVVNKVLHQSECPVWVTSFHQDAPAGKFAIHRVLCAIDFGSHSQDLLQAAQAMAKDFGAGLTLTHITPSVEIYGPGGYHVLQEMKDTLVSSATKRLATLQQEAGTSADVVVACGDVPKMLPQVAKESGADLLMVRCRSRGARLGTHGYGIIRESQIPVLSV